MFIVKFPVQNPGKMNGNGEVVTEHLNGDSGTNNADLKLFDPDVPEVQTLTKNISSGWL